MVSIYRRWHLKSFRVEPHGEPWDNDGDGPDYYEVHWYAERWKGRTGTEYLHGKVWVGTMGRCHSDSYPWFSAVVGDFVETVNEQGRGEKLKRDYAEEEAYAEKES